MLIGDLLRRSARVGKEKTALICSDRTLSFGEIDALVDRLAAGLRARGLGPGDVVSLYGENSWAWVIAHYGIARAGCVINPVNALLTPEEFGYIAADCGAKFVISSAQTSGGLGALDIPLVSYGKPGGLGEPFAALLDAGSPCADPAATETDRAVLCYTSGTTGRPKGASLSHRNVVTNARLTATMHGRTAHDIVVSALPLPHVYGNVVLNAAMLAGSTLALFPRFETPAIIQAISGLRATMFEGVPTMYHYLLADPTFSSADLSSLRLCTVGGQTMPVGTMEAIEAATGCPLIELWGMTELGGLGTTHPHLGPHRHGSIGVALPFMETRITASDAPDRALGTGEIGELCVRGPLVMQGYHGKPEATAEVLDADGWLHTGDMGYRDADGFIFVVDRKKDMILTAGYNIYPAELERAVATHPAIAMTAVVGVPDPVKGEVPVAYVVLRTGAEAGADEILMHVRRTLAPYKVPRRIIFVAELPTTSTGKVMRRALRDVATTAPI